METRQKTKKSSRPILVIKGVRCCTIKHIAKELNKDSAYLRKRFKIIGIKPFAVRNATNYYEMSVLSELKQTYSFKNVSWKGQGVKLKSSKSRLGVLNIKRSQGKAELSLVLSSSLNGLNKIELNIQELGIAFHRTFGVKANMFRLIPPELMSDEMSFDKATFYVGFGEIDKAVFKALCFERYVKMMIRIERKKQCLN